jgi:putative aldouronate transport system substrate-binding protein
MEGFNVPPLKDVPVGEKTMKLVKENKQYVVTNPALVLNSPTYTDRGKELDTSIQDAESKFIMGKIDEAGWQAEIQNWKKAGGDAVIKEYEADYAKTRGKAPQK